MNSSNLCQKFTFNEIGDERGKLVVVEGGKTIPFEIARIFYIYGARGTAVRGQHANRKSTFLFINVAGSVKVEVTDGTKNEIIELNNPNEALLVPKMIWKNMYDFSDDAVLLVLSDEHYDGNEYIRDFDSYCKEMKNYNAE